MKQHILVLNIPEQAFIISNFESLVLNFQSCCLVSTILKSQAHMVYHTCVNSNRSYEDKYETRQAYRAEYPSQLIFVEHTVNAEMLAVD